MMTDEQWAKRLQERQDQANEIEYRVPGFEFERHEDGNPAFGGWAPWQADAHLHGAPCYLRFRHNQASLTVYDRERESYNDLGQKEILSSVIWPYYPEGHPDHHVHTGAPNDEDIAEMIGRLIKELAPVSEDNPSSLMIMERTVNELVDAERRGEIRWVIRNPDGTTMPLDDVYPRTDQS